MGAGIIVEKRINHRTVRQGFAGTVVVGDDDIHAQAAGERGHVHGVDAAVYAHQKVGIRSQRAHGLFIQAVAFALAVGQVDARFRAQGAQVQKKNGRGAYAVHIVIAIDADALARRQRRLQARHGPVHVREEQRIVQQRFRRRQKRLGLGGGGDAALDQKRMQKMGHAFRPRKMDPLRLAFVINEHSFPRFLWQMPKKEFGIKAIPNSP